MVSPVDGPGPASGTFLPVPSDPRSVVPHGLTQREEEAGATSARRRTPSVSEAVATPIGPDAAPSDPFRDRPDAFRRSLFAPRPTSSFLAQALGQEGDGGSRRAESEEAARRYRGVQEAVNREAARRSAPPGLDIEI